MKQPNHCALGVCVWPEPVKNTPRTVSYPNYVHEILAHAGLCYERISPELLPSRLSSLRVLVTVGEHALPDDLRPALAEWVRSGGEWLSVAGVCGLPEVFGVVPEPPAMPRWLGGPVTLGEGYLLPVPGRYPPLGHIRIPLHYFNGLAVRADGGTCRAAALDAHQRETGRAALVERRFGLGRATLIAPDITGTVVRIQQGVAITRDGVPGGDGATPISDQLLKSEDGGVLDWIFDRSAVPGVPGYNAFLEPIADQWRELLLRAVFHACRRQGVSLPLLWLYPRNLPALALMTHDSDDNNVESARKLIRVLDQAGIKSSWCIILPGYPREVIGEIRAAGHELAAHYDAYAEGTCFSEREFSQQISRLTELLGEKPVTNKNHVLRWEGDTEFFDWCVRCGIRFDETKGPSKVGSAGFTFGTCHPHFPVAPDGRLIDVLEVPTVTQDLIRFVPRELGQPLMKAAIRHHGILHLLFHPAHMVRPGIPRALLSSVAAARRKGLEWWTARQVNDWERARRKATWIDCSDSRAVLRTEADLAEATIVSLGSLQGRVKINGKLCPTEPVRRWGVPFQALTFDAKAGSEYVIEVA